MPSNFWGPLISGGAALAGGLLGRRAGNRIGDIATAAGDRAIDEIRPFATAGTDALARLNDPNAYQQSPGFKFALDQQQKQLQQSAAARGGLYSGNTLKALQANAVGLASQDHNNWWAQQAGLVNTGANAAGNIGNVIVGAGRDRAEGAAAGANSMNAALGTVGGIASDYLTGGAVAGLGAAGTAGAGAAGTAGATAAGAAGTGAAAGGTAAAGGSAVAAPAAAGSVYGGLPGLGLAGMAIAGALILRDQFKKDPAIAGAKYDPATGQMQLSAVATSRDSPLGYYAGDKKNAGSSIASTYGISDDEIWQALQPVLAAYSSASGDRGAKIKASLGTLQEPPGYAQYRKIMGAAGARRGNYKNATAQELIDAGFSKEDIIANYAYHLASDRKAGLAKGKNDIFKAIDLAQRSANNQRVIAGA